MPLSNSDITFVSELIYKTSGNIVTARQNSMLEQRLRPLAKQEGFECIEALLQALRKTPHSLLANKVAEAVTINETSFFRDPHVFDALRFDLLPDLVGRKKGFEKLRIWSAACSSGQEAHSLAILVAEAFPEFVDQRLEIIATDISQEMVAKTKSGIYRQLEIERGMSKERVDRFFQREGKEWKASDEIRRTIRAQQLNLLKPFPRFGEFDVVLIRNVLIYFDPPTKMNILRKIIDSIPDGGFLFIGASENLIGMDLPLERHQAGRAVAYQVNRAKGLQARRA